MALAYAIACLSITIVVNHGGIITSRNFWHIWGVFHSFFSEFPTFFQKARYQIWYLSYFCNQWPWHSFKNVLFELMERLPFVPPPGLKKKLTFFFSNSFPIIYCKRFYFRAINFSRFAAQKHIRGISNEQMTCHFCCTRAQSFSMNNNFTGQHKNKAGLGQTIPICINAHGQYSYVSRISLNIVNIFAGFWIRACWISWNSRKLMYRVTVSTLFLIYYCFY